MGGIQNLKYILVDSQVEHRQSPTCKNKQAESRLVYICCWARMAKVRKV
jgi:hypothetical protein